MSSLDASEEMLRFMTNVFRHGYRDVKMVVTSPFTLVEKSGRFVGNLRTLREVLKDNKKSQDKVANAKSVEEVEKALNESYAEMLVRLPGENDKIIFRLKSEHVRDFSEYMKEHGDAAYIMSDVTPEGDEKPMKMVTMDKGEITKVQDFLRSKSEALDGRECLTIPKEYIEGLKELSRVAHKEIEIEKAREAAIKESALDDPNVKTIHSPITDESHNLSNVQIERIDELADNCFDHAIGADEEISEAFTPRSAETFQLRNDNRSEQLEQGLSKSRNERLQKPSVKSKSAEKSWSVSGPTKTAVRGMDDIKAGHRPINNAVGLDFVRGLPNKLTDDYVVDVTNLDPSILSVFRASQPVGFNLHQTENKTILSFRKEQLEEFVLTLSPESTKPIDRSAVVNQLVVGNKERFAREISRVELLRDNPDKKVKAAKVGERGFNFSHAKKNAKTAREQMENTTENVARLEQALKETKDHFAKSAEVVKEIV